MAAIVLAVLWLEQKHCNLHERMIEFQLFQSRAKCLVNQLQFNMRSSCKCGQVCTGNCCKMPRSGFSAGIGPCGDTAHSPKAHEM